MNLKTVRAYNLKLSLQEFWSINERLLAEDYLKKWYFWAMHSRLKPMIEVAKTIKAHWNGILNYFDSRINNAILEGTNSVIQLLKANSLSIPQMPSNSFRSSATECFEAQEKKIIKQNTKENKKENNAGKNTLNRHKSNSDA